MTDHDDSRGAAQQPQPEEITTKVQRPIKEDVKEPAEEAAMGAPSVDAQPRVNQQSFDFAQLLDQKLREQRE